MKWFSLIIILSLVLGQFKTEKQREIEEILMAPCCGGGTLAEHDDNQVTLNMKRIMNALTSEDYDAKQVSQLVTEAYSGNSAYNMGFAPATKRLPEIRKYVEANVHPGMSLDEIVDLFAYIHSERIRSMPKNEGLGYLAWKMPIAILLTGIIVITLVVRSLVNKTVPAANQSGPAVDPELEKRIEKEMKGLNI